MELYCDELLQKDSGSTMRAKEQSGENVKNPNPNQTTLFEYVNWIMRFGYNKNTKRSTNNQRHGISMFSHGANGLHSHLAATSRWRHMKRRTAAASAVFVFFLIVGGLVFAGYVNTFYSLLSASRLFSFGTTTKTSNVIYHLKCNNLGNQSQTCPRNNPITLQFKPIKPNLKKTTHDECPSYFRWIHEDLRPWKEHGITRDMVDRAQKTAHFRLVIVDGKVYVEKYRAALQTRDVFTLWGILQLLKLYPKRLPDLELMFDCDDRPTIRSKDFKRSNVGAPPLFRYCGDYESLDIAFPDWSYWGWVETNIKPWASVLKDIEEGNKKIKWEGRIPYAYWRGNPHVAPTRRDLLKCNLTDKYDWNTRLYIQDWDKESQQGFKQSKLADQCTHRYKIYVEGWAWSVSEKYILACDSMILLVSPKYYDFFTRGMVPLQHYWPIRDNSKCTSLKFAVEWGNNHTDKAKAIGEAGSHFIHEELKMPYVYDYMFHLLNEYAKLFKYKPTIPVGAMELCLDVMACNANGTYRNYMIESMVKSPSDTVPCNLPPPYHPKELQAFNERKVHSIRQVEMWENEYWQHVKKKNI